MRNYYKRSAHKFEKNVLNEDAAIAKKNVIAVSGGAGGGGVFAERWSKYLLKKLPLSPIFSFQKLDAWIDEIWEPFYNECEEEAKRWGGLFWETHSVFLQSSSQTSTRHLILSATKTP